MMVFSIIEIIPPIPPISMLVFRVYVYTRVISNFTNITKCTLNIEIGGSAGENAAGGRWEFFTPSTVKDRLTMLRLHRNLITRLLVTWLT